MQSKHRMVLRLAFVLLVGCGLALGAGFDHDHDHDHGHGHGRDHGHDRDRVQVWHRDHDDYRWRDADRRYVEDWYQDHEGDLPPGLAKRRHLPPGLERQLDERGELPPGLRRRIEPCPRDLWRRLPPPPPDCEYALVTGHLILLNRRNFSVLMVFHFGN